MQKLVTVIGISLGLIFGITTEGNAGEQSLSKNHFINVSLIDSISIGLKEELHFDFNQPAGSKNTIFYNTSEPGESVSKDVQAPRLRAVGFMSMEAEVEELDPFFGIGIYNRKITDKDVHIWGIDVLFGSGIKEVSYGGATMRQEFDDYLYLFTYNHGFITGSSGTKSIYPVLGGGIAYEDAVVETTILGQKITQDLSGFGFLLNVGIGYSDDKIDFLALYTLIPGSGNVTGALYLSLGTQF